MKFVWKGKFESMNKLPKGDLPENAVKYEEPDDLLELNTAASKFLIIVSVILFLGIIIKLLLGHNFHIIRDISLYGIVASLLTVLPHELLHGIAFPKDAIVEIWYSLKYGAAFVVSTHPISKRRFIFMSLLPNIVFGLVPFIIWIFFFKERTVASSVIYTFSTLCLTFGVGDYMNVYNTIKQVPKGAMTQLSGFHSYWYKEKVVL